MLEKIKLSMRISHNAIDADIELNIAACMLDLQRVGVSKKVAADSSSDFLIIKAAEMYCKWQYDFNSKGELYKQAYESLRDAISLCEKYITESEQSDV